MKYDEPGTLGDKFLLQMTIARAVSRYSEGKGFPKKLTDLLKDLLFENLREDIVDDDMAFMLETACEEKRLDPEEVMAHFSAITEDFQDLISD